MTCHSDGVAIKQPVSAGCQKLSRVMYVYSGLNSIVSLYVKLPSTGDNTPAQESYCPVDGYRVLLKQRVDHLLHRLITRWISSMRPAEVLTRLTTAGDLSYG